MLYLDMDTPPACPCHDIPMRWARDDRRISGGYWRCREARRALDAARWQTYYHHRMPTSVRYGPRYLKNRHAKALARRRERQLRS